LCVCVHLNDLVYVCEIEFVCIRDKMRQRRQNRLGIILKSISVSVKQISKDN